MNGHSIRTAQVLRTATWETLPGAALRKSTTLPRSFTRGRSGNRWTHTALSIGQAGNALQSFANEYAPTAAERRMARVMHGRTLAAFPAANVVIGASVDPMARHPWSLALEHAGTAFLALHGEHATRPDVWSVRHGRFVPRPDDVAFRGTVRYELPRSARYGRNGAQMAAESHTAVLLNDVSDVPSWSTWTVTELLTTDRSTNGGTGRDRRGWRGHRRIVWQIADRNATRDAARSARRAVRRAARAAAVGTTRGKAVGPWALAAASVPRRITTDAQRTNVAALENLLRTSAAGAQVTFGPVTVDVLDGATVAMDGRAFPIREWARRATLAAVDAAHVD